VLPYAVTGSHDSAAARNATPHCLRLPESPLPENGFGSRIPRSFASHLSTTGSTVRLAVTTIAAASVNYEAEARKCRIPKLDVAVSESRLPLHISNDLRVPLDSVLRLCSVNFDQRCKMLSPDQLRSAGCAPF
jgi:hypothetical protein